MRLKGKSIGLAVTGSFCTLDKVIPQIEKLKLEGAQVYVIFSENMQKIDTRFGTAREWFDKFSQVSGNPIITTIPEAEPIGPQGLLDCIIVAPCTGNTLGKLTAGVTDTTVLMAAKAHLRNLRPAVIGISTNDGLSNNAKNIGILLNTKNIYFVPFKQDDPMKKPNSLVANMNLIVDTVLAALEGEQFQPLLDS